MYAQTAQTPRVRISPNVVSTRLRPTHVSLRVYSPRGSTTNDPRLRFTTYDLRFRLSIAYRVTTLYHNWGGIAGTHGHDVHGVHGRMVEDAFSTRLYHAAGVHNTRAWRMRLYQPLR